MEYIIIIVSILLDGILSNFLPFMINDLSLFTPMFTLISIFIIYPYFKKKEKKYFITIFITGIIYDLLYTNLLFFNGLMFLGVGIISYFIYKNLKINIFRILLYIVLIISIYEGLSSIIFMIYNLVPITFYKVFYKISHSLILNIVYGETIYLLLSKISKRYNKVSINLI